MVGDWKMDENGRFFTKTHNGIGRWFKQHALITNWYIRIHRSDTCAFGAISDGYRWLVFDLPL